MTSSGQRPAWRVGVRRGALASSVVVALALLASFHAVVASAVERSHHRAGAPTALVAVQGLPGSVD